MNTDKTALTEGVVWKKLLLFALPIFFGNVFQQLYNTVDSLIVGNFIGDSALAAVSSSGSLIFLLVGFFNGIAMGAGVLISKYFGAKDYLHLRYAVHTAVAFGLAAGILLMVLGVSFTPSILRWMGTPEEVLPNSVAYFRVYFYGALFVVLYNMFVGILQAVGDSRHPLYYLILSSILNVLLDLLFVGVFKWGVASAALATTISQGVSATLCLIRLVRYKTVYQLSVRKIRFHLPILKKLVLFGLPSGMQNSIIAFANIIVQSNINNFGKSAMAGCGSYSKIEGFAFLPITCFAMSLATFVGQNLGAKQYDRVKKGTRFGIICSCVMAELIGLCIFTFAPSLIGLFNDTAEVVAFGIHQCRVQSLFYCLLAFSHCTAGILRGAGKAVIPMVITLLSWCVIRIIYITVTISLIPRIEIVFSAYPITWTISSIVFFIYYKKADWIHNFERMDTPAKKA